MKQKIVLIVSVVVGLLAAFLTRTYLSAKDAEYRDLKLRYRAKHGEMRVLCFAKGVPGGTVLQKSDLGTKVVPETGLRGQALTEENLSDVLGRKTVVGHRIGDVLFWNDVEGGNPVAGGLAADVKKLMRAVSVNVSGAASVSGMVRPNDHVDVIATFAFPDPKTGGKEMKLVTYTILQNVLVLATGRETAKSSRMMTGLAANGTYSTVTLEVSLREAEMLVFAEQIKGRLSLALRNRNDTSYERELPKVDFEQIQGEIESLNQKRQLKMGAR